MAGCDCSIKWAGWEFCPDCKPHKAEWYCGPDTPTPETYTTFTNSANSWTPNYILDARRKRTPDGSEAYINQGGCALPGNKYLLILCNIDYTKFELLVVDTYNYTFVTHLMNVTGLGHGNDAVYYDGKIYICTYTGEGLTGGLAVYDWNTETNTLSFERTLSLDVPAASITVDESGQFYSRIGQTFYKIWPELGTSEKLFTFEINAPEGSFYNNIVEDWSLTGQGLDYYNGVFYSCYSFPNVLVLINKEGTVLNYINIPQVSQGHPVGELESIGIDKTTGRMFFNSYGRSINDDYELEDGAQVEKTWGFTYVYEVGPTSILNWTSEFRANTNQTAGHTVGSRRNVYIEANTNYMTPSTFRHTGAVNYPFDTIQNAFYYASQLRQNSSRLMPEIYIKGDIGAYSKWGSLYTNCSIYMEDAHLEQLHVGDAVSTKIEGTGSIDKIVLMYGSTLDCRVDGKVITSSSGNTIWLFPSETANPYTPEVHLNGSIVRIFSGVKPTGTLSSCVLFGPEHDYPKNATEWENCEIVYGTTYYGGVASDFIKQAHKNATFSARVDHSIEMDEIPSTAVITAIELIAGPVAYNGETVNIVCPTYFNAEDFINVRAVPGESFYSIKVNTGGALAVEMPYRLRVYYREA